MNTPPFRIGQKVVAVKDSEHGYFKKDKIYRVLDIQVCNCGYVTICIGKIMDKSLFQSCTKCSVLRREYGEPAFHGVSNFAPIEESRSSIKYVAVSESLREKAIEIAYMKAGYKVEHNAKKDFLGDKYRVAVVHNYKHLNEVWITYFRKIEDLYSRSSLTAIFRIKPKKPTTNEKNTK